MTRSGASHYELLAENHLAAAEAATTIARCLLAIEQHTTKLNEARKTLVSSQEIIRKYYTEIIAGTS